MEADRLVCPVTNRECLSSRLCQRGIDLQDEDDRQREVYPLQVSEAVLSTWDPKLKSAAESSFCAQQREKALHRLANRTHAEYIRVSARGLAENITIARRLHQDRG